GPGVRARRDEKARRDETEDEPRRFHRPNPGDMLLPTTRRAAGTGRRSDLLTERLRQGDGGRRCHDRTRRHVVRDDDLDLVRDGEAAAIGRRNGRADDEVGTYPREIRRV